MQMTVLLPELALGLMALAFFGLSLGRPEKKILRNAAFGGSALVVSAAVASLSAQGVLFFEAYRVDLFSQTFKLLIALGFFGVMMLGSGLSGIRRRLSAEYLMFLSISTLGLMALVSSAELLTMLLSLEISSFALYVVIPMRRNGAGGRAHFEAGLKYVLFGALSTGVTLFGMSYLFGLCGTTYIPELAKVLPGVVSEQPLGVIAVLMVLSGFFYKLAMFPMHFWTPDVYEGAANETTAFVATLPKIGAVALLMRLVAASGADSGQMTWILSTFAVLSMTAGNLAALVQEDIKRLLAYSSIAHAGYVMVGILSAGSAGFSAAAYYAVGYLVMSLGCFYVIYHLAEEGRNVTFDSLKGLHKRSPLLAFTLAAAAFGMAGIPPTVGFPTKFLVFTAAIGKGYYGLVVLAVINAAISAFYYLKLVRAAYTLPADEKTETMALGIPVTAFGVAVTGMILAAGIFPQEIVRMARDAVALLL